MSSKDDAHGGRFEPQTSRAASPGMVITSQCDECQSQGSSAGRRRMRVARGPLRGLVGNVCRACVARREQEKAAA